jgi:hypothetical protein
VRREIRIAGFGGQGVVTMGTILAVAAGIYEDLEVAQTQSYGPEARGGACRSDIIISDEPIDYTKPLALDVFIEPGVWIALKRTLRNRTMEMQSYDPFYLFASSSALKPEPIEVRVKVVMIGDAYLYETLYAMDEDFKKIFKIKADFDSVMERKEEAQLQYASFIRKRANPRVSKSCRILEASRSHEIFPCLFRFLSIRDFYLMCIPEHNHSRKYFLNFLVDYRCNNIIIFLILSRVANPSQVP